MRTNFRKLPFDGDYWLASNLGVAPDTKVGRRVKCTGVSTTTGALTLTTVPDTTVAVVKIQRFQMVQQ